MNVLEWKWHVNELQKVKNRSQIHWDIFITKIQRIYPSEIDSNISNVWISFQFWKWILVRRCSIPVFVFVKIFWAILKKLNDCIRFIYACHERRTNIDNSNVVRHICFYSVCEFRILLEKYHVQCSGPLSYNVIPA